MQTYTSRYLAALSQSLASVSATGTNGAPQDLDAGFASACELTVAVKKNSGTIYFVGNGASAMMSSHMAADFLKNGKLRALALNDAALLTAVGNDIGYSQAFELPITSLGRPGDMLVTISSSGNSPNVLEAIKAARAQGMSVITFSGMKPDNKSRALGDVNFYVPARTYGVVENIHAVLLHCWLDRYMDIKEWDETR